MLDNVPDIPILGRVYGLPSGGLRVAILVLALAILGCNTREPPMPQSPTQHEECGLTLQVRRLPLKNSKTNNVEYVEEIKNTSDRPICFALRNGDCQLVQIASRKFVDGKLVLVRHREPKDFSLFDRDSESDRQIVNGFISSSSSYDGGEVIEPSETITYPSESFVILRAGLYHLQSKWSVDILDAREAPHYKVLRKCTIRSNVLDLDIVKDDRADQTVHHGYWPFR